MNGSRSCCCVNIGSVALEIFLSCGKFNTAILNVILVLDLMRSPLHRSRPTQIIQSVSLSRVQNFENQDYCRKQKNMAFYVRKEHAVLESKGTFSSSSVACGHILLPNKTTLLRNLRTFAHRGKLVIADQVDCHLAAKSVMIPS